MVRHICKVAKARIHADIIIILIRLRDQVGLIDESSEMDALCSHVKDTGGVYFVTAFSGLLAP